MGRFLAVLWQDGGLGDVGKHVVAQALKHPDVLRVRAIGPPGYTLGRAESVTQPEVPSEDQRLEVVTLDATRPENADALLAALEGVDAVVSCLACRQPFWTRRAATGAVAVIRAMEHRGITRLVQMSTPGAHESKPFMAWHFTPGSWMAWFIGIVLGGGIRDCEGAEDAVIGSRLDYLILRPTGLSPELAPTGEVDFMVDPWREGGHKVAIEVAKEDAAAAFLKEALEPTMHRTIRTMGAPFKEAATD